MRQRSDSHAGGKTGRGGGKMGLWKISRRMRRVARRQTKFTPFPVSYFCAAERLITRLSYSSVLIVITLLRRAFARRGILGEPASEGRQRMDARKRQADVAARRVERVNPRTKCATDFCLTSRSEGLPYARIPRIYSYTRRYTLDTPSSVARDRVRHAAPARSR